VISLMTDNLVVFYTTAEAVQQGVRAWPAQPKLWPTYVMLGVAALNAFLAAMVLIGYCWSVRVANRCGIGDVGFCGCYDGEYDIVQWGWNAEFVVCGL